MKNTFQNDLRRCCGLLSAIVARCRPWRGESGGAIVELALTLSLLGVPMLAGTVDMGIYIYDSIEVSDAAHAAAMYGSYSSGYATDNTTMKSIAQADAANFGAGLTATPSTFYVCSSAIGGAQYSTQSAATTACTGAGNHPLQLVQVLTTANAAVPIHVPTFPSTLVVSGTSVMEVQE